jgi:hypothetical protein
VEAGCDGGDTKPGVVLDVAPDLMMVVSAYLELKLVTWKVGRYVLMLLTVV